MFIKKNANMCRLLPQLPYTNLADPLKNRLGSVEPFQP